MGVFRASHRVLAGTSCLALVVPLIAVGQATSYAGTNPSRSYKTAGTYQWTVPTGATEVYFETVGGGGGGGGGGSNAVGGVSSTVIGSFALAAGTVLTGYVGGGGAGSSNGGGGGGSSAVFNGSTPLEIASGGGGANGNNAQGGRGWNNSNSPIGVGGNGNGVNPGAGGSGGSGGSAGTVPSCATGDGTPTGGQAGQGGPGGGGNGAGGTGYGTGIGGKACSVVSGGGGGGGYGGGGAGGTGGSGGGGGSLVPSGGAMRNGGSPGEPGAGGAEGQSGEDGSVAFFALAQPIIDSVTGGPGQLTVSWSDPDNQSLPVTLQYQVYLDGQPAANATSSPAVITGLTEGKVYSVTVVVSVAQPLLRTVSAAVSAAASIRQPQTPQGFSVPKHAKRAGRTQLLPAHPLSNAHQRVRVKVLNAKLRGDVRTYSIKRYKNGRVVLITYGHPLTMKLKFWAPPTPQFYRYRHIQVLRT